MYNNFSKTLPKNAHTEKLIKNVKTAAVSYLNSPIQSLKYSVYANNLKTGERLAYEQIYIEHRKRLNVFLIMALYSPDEIYIKELCDILWAICDEFTWCLPAHTYVVQGKQTISDFETAIDLFAAETAFYLSEAVYLVKDRIDSMVCSRVEHEVKRRVINPYLSENLTWAKNNWSGVCASSIGISMIYFKMYDEFEKAKPKLLKSIDDFLESYDNDGCCKEDALYWVYGFGFFCYFAELLNEYTNGKTNYFNLKKVKNIAHFGENIFLKNNHIIPFSDAPHELNYNIGLFTLLSKKYGTHLPSFDNESLFGDDVRYRMCHMIRDFFWYDENLPASRDKTGFFCYRDAMWYINKKENYSFAAKGGNNNEPHNHNDLGSFILYDNGKYIIDDLGWPVYEKDYFSPDVRYENLCASSRGHSVFSFDNKEQITGDAGYAVLLEATENCFALDLSAAYEPNKKITRKFQLSNKEIKITDLLPFKAAERFVTRLKPQILNSSTVKIENWHISCNAPCKIEIQEKFFHPRNTIVKSSMKDTERAYLIDFIPIKYNKNTEILISK